MAAEEEEEGETSAFGLRCRTIVKTSAPYRSIAALPGAEEYLRAVGFEAPNTVWGMPDRLFVRTSSSAARAAASALAHAIGHAPEPRGHLFAARFADARGAAARVDASPLFPLAFSP